jgi:glycosidase
MKHKRLVSLLIAQSFILISCQQPTTSESKVIEKQSIIVEDSFYGTTLPFASEAVYFLMTDRFVDGDPSNNQVHQGGDYPTFQQPIISEGGKKAFVGYMGGDFKGILNNADYISKMGFTSIWLTPIVDQPDEAFSGGEKIEFGGAFKDGGKTGYHGYWGTNFYQVDEHLPSSDLSFKQLTSKLRNDFNIKTVLDIVANHGSPAFSMTPKQQAKYGQLFDQNNQLVADHQNLEHKNLNPDNPLHQFYYNKPDIMQLSDFNAENPAVMDYFVGAYLHWIEQGADAFRIDTIKHMPHSFWKIFSDRIREKHPEYFMFAESYSFDANFISQHTLAKNGAVSVLDFPGRESMLKVFENQQSDYSEILSYLYLTDGPYQNPYELMTFYDNHDMSRMNADQNGFIDAHNWLFTSRGIPVLYYGSEIAFMAGTAEHQGNRNYFGEENIQQTKSNPVKNALTKIANLRKNFVSLQKGLQINLAFSGNQAAFYRVYQHQGINQTALVLLNKGDDDVSFDIMQYLSEGEWLNAMTGKNIQIGADGKLKSYVKGHGVAIYILNAENSNPDLIDIMRKRMANK